MLDDKKLDRIAHEIERRHVIVKRFCCVREISLSFISQSTISSSHNLSHNLQSHNLPSYDQISVSQSTISSDHLIRFDGSHLCHKTEGGPTCLTKMIKW